MTNEQLYAAPLTQSVVAGGRLYADRHEMIKALRVPPRGRIAEIGVAFGDFSTVMIREKNPEVFYAFDLFELHHVKQIWGKSAAETFGEYDHLTFFSRRMASEGFVIGNIKSPAIAGNTVVVPIVGDSSARMSELENGSLDLIYIDGDHALDGVIRDAKVAVSKISKDGLLVFNDYIAYDHIGHIPYGVVPVVNDLCLNHGFRVEGFAFKNDMFCDIAISRRPISI